jgi:hypothetical protein
MTKICVEVAVLGTVPQSVQADAGAALADIPPSSESLPTHHSFFSNFRRYIASAAEGAM